MFRRLMSYVLRADLDPNVAWPDIESLTVEARISVQVPRLWSGSESLEQVLCVSGDQYVLFKRWLSSGRLSRVTFGRVLDGRELRLTESLPGPPPVYRLQLTPAETKSVAFLAARPTWFRLWRNEGHMDFGPGLSFIDSTDRQLLRDLRYRLLDGKIPESLGVEEEMWQRINTMPEAERHSAMAALTMQSLAALKRQFTETHPDECEMPEELRPAAENIQRRVHEVEVIAGERPIDPALADLMQRYVADATSRASTVQKRAEQRDEGERR